jgi:formylglycine-generating enzyme required for sulfatase activity
MGTEEGTKIERPVHKVYLREFRISRFEVSNIEFEIFQPNHTRSVSSPCDQCPVTMVNWFEASSYCKNKNGRLPSEAEWEKAARGPAEYR